jgi:hypothetical protein
MAALDAPPPIHPPLVPAGGQGLLLPQRAQVEVVLQQLPLKLAASGLDQLLQLIVSHLPGPAAGQILHQGLETDSRAGKGVSRSGCVVGFHRALLSGPDLACTLEPRKKSPPVHTSGGRM